jgi:hypothetical protein
MRDDTVTQAEAMAGAEVTIKAVVMVVVMEAEVAEEEVVTVILVTIPKKNGPP